MKKQPSKKLLIENKEILTGLYEAKTFSERLLGLIPKKNLSHNEALFFKRCKQVHSFFMSFPIDVIFLDKNNQILAIDTLKTWRLGRFYRKAQSCIEVQAGLCSKKKIQIGNSVEICDA